MASKRDASRWTFEEAHRNVHVVRVPFDARKGWEFWALCQSDEHWDSIHCRRDLLKADHDEAVLRNAPILKFGDTFDSMAGAKDPRACKDELRPEFLTGNYIDAIVDGAADFYAQYPKNAALFGMGNHETKILKHGETDILARLAKSLRDRGGIARKGGYGGWVRFLFHRGKWSQSVRLYYFHGSGGGGHVNKGLAEFNKLASQITNAHIIGGGHNHWQYAVPGKRQRLNDNNRVEVVPFDYMRCGGYKDEFDDGHSGYHNEDARGPRPLGGCWLRFYRGSDGSVKWQITGTDT